MPPEQAAQVSSDFNVGLGRALIALRHQKDAEFNQIITNLRENVARGLSPASTASVHAAHESLLKLHVLYEVEAMSGLSRASSLKKEMIVGDLDRRLDVLGAYTSEKQYLLGIRRAVMQLSE